NYYGGFMRYVDGYVLPVPKKNLQIYRRIAQKAGKIWREHGAHAGAMTGTVANMTSGAIVD
ncbi:MAG: DUF1428 family protein, partial [Methylococcales bacterium]